jgi:pimeloyl-ACP methyl ester carboxylesterase
MNAFDTRPPETYGRPSLGLLTTELSRMLMGRAWFETNRPWLNRLSHGDGRPVLVLPGFTASDRSTTTLRRLLAELGYDVYAWENGQNMGPSAQVISGVQRRVHDITNSTGQSVTLIGWSLGGLYARALAERFPDEIRHCITMGSPFRVSSGSATWAGTLFTATAKMRPRQAPSQAEHGVFHPGYRGAPPVPTTNLFSRLDGIVPWEACLDDGSPRSENVEVLCAHLGFGHDPGAISVIADRLTLQPNEWRPFKQTPRTTLLHVAKPFLN